MEAATIRRLVAFAVGVVGVVLNKKLGLELDPASEVGLVTLIVGYLGQSAYNEGQTKKAAAVVKAAEIHKGAVTSDAAAVEVLKKSL